MLFIVYIVPFARYGDYVICLISFSKFSDVLPAFICAKAICNL